MKGSFELLASVAFVVLIVVLYDAATYEEPKEKTECAMPTNGAVESRHSFSFRDILTEEVSREYQF